MFIFISISEKKEKVHSEVEGPRKIKNKSCFQVCHKDVNERNRIRFNRDMTS